MNYKKSIGFLIKIGIVLTSLYFLYAQFKDNLFVQSVNGSSYNLKTFLSSEFLSENFFTICIVVFLMFFNWLLESLKWRFLIKKIENISVLTSLRAVFSGITVSAFTPNRIGEYGGRVFCLSTADRIKAVLITVIGSMSQLLITIVFGSIGIVYVMSNYTDDFSEFWSIDGISFYVIIFVLVLLNLLLLLLFLNTSLFTVFLNKLKFLEKYHKYSEVFSFYNCSELFKVLLYSAFRYAVFTFQYYILLQMCSVNIPYTEVMFLVMSMLFIISVIPTIAITEIGVRAYVAVVILGLASVNISGILSATFLLWIINLLIPSVIGMFFVFTLKFFRKK